MQSQKPTFKQRFGAFVKKHKWPIVIIASATVVAGAIMIYLALTGNAHKAFEFVAPQKKAKLTPPKYYSPLTGREVPDFGATIRQVRAIMLENSPDSRPQSGLKDAGVVFEAIAEGGITRFLCLYQEGHPELIGPVRSLRPYYVDWLAAFDATVSHVGGSKNALDEIRNGTYKDIDQFFNGAYYWRATDRYAPHNVYTSSTKLDELNNSKGYTSSSFTGFPRKADTPAAKPNATAIDINISYGAFNVHYDYDKATNDYGRSEGGEGHTDREAGGIRPKVAIVIKVPESLGFEDGYRLQMQTIGNGHAYIFQDGTVTEATWSKPDKRSQITFKDGAGNTIPLNTGQTWITAIAPNRSVTWQ